MTGAPEPEVQVLSTLNADGSRRWLKPKVSPGRFLNGRKAVGYALIAFFLCVAASSDQRQTADPARSAAKRVHVLGHDALSDRHAVACAADALRAAVDHLPDGVVWASLVRLGVPADGVPRACVPTDRAVLPWCAGKKAQRGRLASARQVRNVSGYIFPAR